MVEPSLYLGMGARMGVDGAGLQEEGPWDCLETGLDVGFRLFGIYPIRSRVELQYRGGESPWTLRFSVGGA